MLLLIAIIGCLVAVISDQTPLTLPMPSENLDDVYSMRRPTINMGKKPIRLNGTDPCSGTVQVKISRFWQPVCEDYWSNQASLAVCRELGCVRTQPMASVGLPALERPEGNRSVVPNDTWDSPLSVFCDQGKWESCWKQSSVCTSGRSTKVNCAEVHAVRLVDGVDNCTGRVELMDKGSWGTVCDDSWDLQDANVVCQQLGCGWAIEALEGSYFQKGKGPIHLDEVNCSGSELSLWECPAQRIHDCGHKEDASVICSESLNSSLSLIPKTSSRPQVPTTVSFVPVEKQNELQEKVLFILCIILGILLLGSVITLIFIFLKIKRKYALPIMENHNQQSSTVNHGGNMSNQEVTITIPKEEAPKPFLQVGSQPSKDSDSDSDSDYERYDFHTQPPVPLSTFYNAPVPVPQSHPRYCSESSTSSGEGYCNSPVTKLPQSNFPAFSSQRNHLLEQPPNLELAGSRSTLPDAPLLASQNYMRQNSESSTSSGEGYCNDSPIRKLPPSSFPDSSSERNILEQPPNLELAGSRATLLGDHSGVKATGPAAADSSSTSSGECYENFDSPQVPPVESSVCPEPSAPEVKGCCEDDSSSDDYDDIGAS
ncbi:T-cell differentiation antigen CD6 isoform X2 [Macrotis lagotis]|uniref:T-cell differentiation antigen CD6 isoform X2 n=1 Tax=Macrotis lagotis TaxID=92651 RepID=UPI003D69AE40